MTLKMKVKYIDDEGRRLTMNVKDTVDEGRRLTMNIKNVVGESRGHCRRRSTALKM